MGRCVAKILAQKGANIMIVARNVEKLESTIDELKVLYSLLHIAFLLTPILRLQLQAPPNAFNTSVRTSQRRMKRFVNPFGFAQDDQ